MTEITTPAQFQALMATMKRCRKCDTYKPRIEYSKDDRYADGLNGWCKRCHAEYTAGHLAEHGRSASAVTPTRFDRTMVADLLKKRGVTINESYQKLAWERARADIRGLPFRERLGDALDTVVMEIRERLKLGRGKVA